MTAEKEDKAILEREYIVPLRRKFLRTPKYQRAPKAIKELKRFIAKNMKVYDRDLRKIKIDKYLNEELWFRGIKKPAYKIKVKCKKLESGIVNVELAEMPQIIKYKKAREERLNKKIEEKKEKPEETKKEEVKEEEKKEEIEKEKAVIESGLKQAELQHKEVRLETKMKKEPKRQFRQALQK